jgi:hypothetical protein
MALAVGYRVRRAIPSSVARTGHARASAPEKTLGWRDTSRNLLEGPVTPPHSLNACACLPGGSAARHELWAQWGGVCSSTAAAPAAAADAAPPSPPPGSPAAEGHGGTDNDNDDNNNTTATTIPPFNEWTRFIDTDDKMSYIDMGEDTIDTIISHVIRHLC